MTPDEIIEEHLGPEWWLRSHETAAWQVLFDRLRDGGRPLRNALWRIVLIADVQCHDRYPFTLRRSIDKRIAIRSLVQEGRMLTAASGAWWASEQEVTKEWTNLLFALSDAVALTGVSAESVPSD